VSSQANLMQLIKGQARSCEISELARFVKCHVRNISLKNGPKS